MKYFLVVVCIACCSMAAYSQDPEFPKKEFIMHLKLHNGMVTTFKSPSPDLYAGGLQIIPQYTVVENKIRMGIVAGGFYSGKKMQGLIGPTVAVKLKTLNAGFFGSGGNLHLSFDHLWGTNKQHLLGGAFNADIANKIILTIGIHRDYKLNNWWLQNGVAFRISKVKQPPHP